MRAYLNDSNHVDAVRELVLVTHRNDSGFATRPRAAVARRSGLARCGGVGGGGVSCGRDAARLCRAVPRRGRGGCILRHQRFRHGGLVAAADRAARCGAGLSARPAAPNRAALLALLGGQAWAGARGAGAAAGLAARCRVCGGLISLPARPYRSRSLHAGAARRLDAELRDAVLRAVRRRAGGKAFAGHARAAGSAGAHAIAENGLGDRRTDQSGGAGIRVRHHAGRDLAAWLSIARGMRVAVGGDGRGGTLRAAERAGYAPSRLGLAGCLPGRRRRVAGRHLRGQVAARGAAAGRCLVCHLPHARIRAQRDRAASAASAGLGQPSARVRAACHRHERRVRLGRA